MSKYIKLFRISCYRFDQVFYCLFDREKYNERFFGTTDQVSGRTIESGGRETGPAKHEKQRRNVVR